MASLRTADDVFIDFSGRRRGILRALTAEADKFFEECSPEKENQCLYGYADGTWEVTLPCEEVPPELPEPALGINFARDGMKRNEWMSLVAVHSDSWLMSIAFYNAARLDAEGRRQLFNSINALPTVYEVVSGRASNPNAPVAGAAQVAKRASAHQSAPPAAPPVAAAVGLGGPMGLGGYGAAEPAHHPQQPKRPRPAAAKPKYRREYDEDDEDESDEDESSNEPCPNCGRMYRRGEFWIQCDFCDRWFDGKCVNMTEQKAERQKDWRCPFCTKGA